MSRPDNAIRLAIARQRYNPYGGAERFVARALDALAEENMVSISLLARDWPSAAESPTHWQWRRLDPFYLGRTWRDYSFMRAVQNVRGDYTLLQSHERIPGAAIFRAGDGVHATWLEQYAKTQHPLQRFVTRFTPYHRFVCAMERRMFAHPALRCVICNSRLVRDDIARRFGVSEHKLAVIYNGIDTDAFSPELSFRYRKQQRQAWQIPEDAPLLAFVGSGFKRKGLLTALQALQAHPSIYLVVAGHDKHCAHYKHHANELGVSGHVRFLGNVPDVRPIYGAADAFILPTLYDPFPNACIEALSCGLPLFTSPTCGAAEWLTHHQKNWVIDALNVNGYRAALASWLMQISSPTARDKLKEDARNTALPHTLNAMAKNLTSLYHSIVRNTTCTNCYI